MYGSRRIADAHSKIGIKAGRYKGTLLLGFKMLYHDFLKVQLCFRRLSATAIYG